MEHAERMMIAGLALQGLLANPQIETGRFDPSAINTNVKLALNYAQALGVHTPDETGESLASKALRAARIAYAIRWNGSDVPAEPWAEVSDDIKEHWYAHAVALFSNTPVDERYLSMGDTASAVLKCVVAAWE